MSDVSLFDLLIRVALSLGIVVAVLWVAARVVNGRSTTGRKRTPKRKAAIEIVAQHRLGRRASVAVVQAGGRSLVVGITDQQITLLGEADTAAVHADAADTDTEVEEVQETSHARRTDSPVLGTSTTGANGRASLRGDTDRPTPAWKAALDDLRDRTVRRA